MKTSYVIRVFFNGEFRYLFNTRVLLYDIQLAKHFSSSVLANRYIKKSIFAECEFHVIPVIHQEMLTGSIAK